MRFQVGKVLCELSLDDDGSVQTRWYLGNGRRTEAPKYLCARERRQYRAGREAFLRAAGKAPARLPTGSSWGTLRRIAPVLVVAAMVAAGATMLAGCVTTSMQGYADLDRPARPIEHIAVVAPPALVAALMAEAQNHGILIEDGNLIVPPTRPYKDAEIRQLLTTRGVDGVLVVSVTGDTGVQERYAGTILSANYSGVSSGSAVAVGNMVSGTGVSSGTISATSTPLYFYSRTVAFKARLSDPKSGRNLWVGGGQTRAGGALFMGDATSARDGASTILNDLREKALIASGGA